MTNRVFLIALFAFLSLGDRCFASQWVMHDLEQPSAEVHGPSATITNEEGYVLSVVKNIGDENNSAWIRLALPKELSLRIHPEKLGQWRIDEEEWEEFSDDKRIHTEWREMGMDISMFDYEGKAISSKIWHGDIDQGWQGGTLEMLMNGEKLYAELSLGDGSTVKTVFILAQSAQAIRQLFGLGTSGIETKSQRIARELKEAMMEIDCDTYEDNMACLFKRNDCFASEPKDAEEFRKCFYDDR